MLLAMIFITSGASLAKSLFPLIGVEATVGLRLTFAAILLFIIFRPWRFTPKKTEWKVVIIYGVAMGAMNLSFYTAINRIPLGIALALEFTGPLAVALFSSRSKKDLLWVFFAIAGILLLLPLTKASEHIDPTGIAFALFAGMCWAVYIVIGKRAVAGKHSGAIAAWGLLIGAIMIAPIAIGTTDIASINQHTLIMGFGVALLSSAVPYTLELMALKRLPAKTFSIFTSLEPAIGAASGFIFLSEKLLPIHLLAIALVITASAGSSYFSTRRPKVEVEFSA